MIMGTHRDGPARRRDTRNATERVSAGAAQRTQERPEQRQDDELPFDPDMLATDMENKRRYEW
jgi:hypothetical protein